MSSVSPALLDALLAAFRAHSGLRGVRVWDGPALPSSEQDTLSVGGAGTERDDPEVTSAFTNAGLGQRSESVDVAIQIVSWTGDTDMRPRRERVYAILTAVNAALGVDRALGGLVARVRLGDSVTLAQNQTESGAEAVLEFTIRAETA